LSVIVASQSFHRHCRGEQKKQIGLLTITPTPVIAQGTSAGWVPSEAKAFRYMRSSIGNKRVESCCNNEAMRLEPNNYALMLIVNDAQLFPKVSWVALFTSLTK
jgi:hypothetical protein